MLLERVRKSRNNSSEDARAKAWAAAEFFEALRLTGGEPFFVTAQRHAGRRGPDAMAHDFGFDLAAANRAVAHRVGSDGPKRVFYIVTLDGSPVHVARGTLFGRESALMPVSPDEYFWAAKYCGASEARLLSRAAELANEKPWAEAAEQPRLFLMNALPGSALAGHSGRFRTLSDSEAQSIIDGGGWESAVGHEGTAAALSEWARLEVPFRRVTISLRKGDRLLVAALRGPRLEEGRILSRKEVLERGFEFLLVEIDG